MDWFRKPLCALKKGQAWGQFKVLARFGWKGAPKFILFPAKYVLFAFTPKLKRNKKSLITPVISVSILSQLYTMSTHQATRTTPNPYPYPTCPTHRAKRHTPHLFPLQSTFTITTTASPETMIANKATATATKATTTENKAMIVKDFGPEVYFNDLPLHRHTWFICTFGQAIRLPNVTLLPISLILSHGSMHKTVLTACFEIVHARSQLNPDYTWYDYSNIYFQPTHNAPQKYFREIREDSFEIVLEDIWRAEGRCLRTLADVEVHLYVFVQPKQPKTHRSNLPRRNVDGPHGHHRATKAPTTAGMRENTSSVQNGIIPRAKPITMRHRSRHSARRLDMVEDGVSLMDMPQTNTFRQIQHLDQELDDLRQRILRDRNFYNEEYWALRFRIDGQVVELQVELRSLREALNLPDIDLHGQDDH